MPPSFDDYYAILDLGRAAGADEIRRAFRDQARRWHPDKNRAPGADERFMKVYESYEILSNPWKRKIYDGRLNHAEDRASPEYEAWRAEARRHARQFSHTNFDLFMRQTFPDPRAILFGAPPPDLFHSVVIFLKIFTAVSVALILFAIPWSLKQSLSFLPVLVISAMKLDPSLLPWVEMAAVTVAAVTSALVIVAVILGGRAMGFSWADSALHALAFCFLSEERLVPLAHAAISGCVSLGLWGYVLYQLRSAP